MRIFIIRTRNVKQLKWEVYHPIITLAFLLRSSNYIITKSGQEKAVLTSLIHIVFPGISSNEPKKMSNKFISSKIISLASFYSLEV